MVSSYGSFIVCLCVDVCVGVTSWVWPMRLSSACPPENRSRFSVGWAGLLQLC